ncbi:MAG TPA: exonuclease SbcCD subunit D [Nocardioidaceae bacterium]|nr:exonuclease SbcCD subunit D [Nocardioidaceae bacterium]
MRILHTSDWHLGRSFHREGMLGAQAAFVDHLVETIAAERVDLVLVSGDVYDRALPPVDAVALADETFARLAASRAQVVVTSGNHDSARRLGFNSRLIDASGVYFRTDATSAGTPVLLEDEHGPVAVYGLPYLEPDVLREPWQLESRTHTAVLTEAMRRVDVDRAARPSGTRSVAMAHAFVAGGAASDSERDISVGGVSIVPTRVFETVDYAALGHLHGRHTLTDSIRYSGSPLAYSFSETHHRKGSWVVELGRDGFERADFLDAPVPRQLAQVRGDLEDLLHDPRHADKEDCWVQAVLTDPVRPRQAMERLRTRFPHTLILSFEPTGGEASPVPGSRPLTGRSDHEIGLDFVREVRGTPASEAEAALLLEACDSCKHGSDADQVVGA